MATKDIYTIQVLPGTRNHRGCFVQESMYRLVEVNAAGWALICLDEVSCHYVDPDSLHKLQDA